MLHDFLYLSYLFDVYGTLLTKKQQECLKLYLFSDLSTTEISTKLSISRQAVHDMLRKAEHILNLYEEKLHFIAHERELFKKLKNMHDASKSYHHKNPSQEEMYKKIATLEKKLDDILSHFSRFTRVKSFATTKEIADDF